MLVAKALIKATPCLGAWEHQEEVGLSSGNEVLLKKTKESRILRRVGVYRLLYCTGRGRLKIPCMLLSQIGNAILLTDVMNKELFTLLELLLFHHAQDYCTDPFPDTTFSLASRRRK